MPLEASKALIFAHDIDLGEGAIIDARDRMAIDNLLGAGLTLDDLELSSNGQSVTLASPDLWPNLTQHAECLAELLKAATFEYDAEAKLQRLLDPEQALGWDTQIGSIK